MGNGRINGDLEVEKENSDRLKFEHKGLVAMEGSECWIYKCMSLGRIVMNVEEKQDGIDVGW